MSGFADKTQMQNRLFSELSNMFGKEVPLYDKSLLVNKICNQTVCALLAQIYSGFTLSNEQLEKTSGERHGAIRIGKPSEYRWVTAYFAAFGLEPHNFYDMTNIGGKSQPIVATAFRSSLNPEHRVFCSLLMTDYFDPEIRRRIEDLLATREVFSDRAKELVLKNQTQNGLDEKDAKELIHEGVTRIFKWTGRARDFQLYQDLCKAGFKIAADIACFENHHLNHLTPNTFWMELYIGAMKFCLGEMDAKTHSARARQALDQLQSFADRDYMRLHFKHLDHAVIDSYEERVVPPDFTGKLAAELTGQLQQPGLQLSKLKHAGFKDFTEGPPSDTPILLRQDAYKALTEPVIFQQADGTAINGEHTARFGEIEQRFYATTPAGRKLYDQCLADAANVSQQHYAECFAPFPKTLPKLLAAKLVYGKYRATAKGLAAKEKGAFPATNLDELIRLGYIAVDGLRYEDFLPISAAGIFASNLGQYGTKSTASAKPIYTRSMLEEILGRKIIDTDNLYRQLEEDSIREAFEQLGLTREICPDSNRVAA